MWTDKVAESFEVNAKAFPCQHCTVPADVASPVLQYRGARSRLWLEWLWQPLMVTWPATLPAAVTSSQKQSMTSAMNKQTQVAIQLQPTFIAIVCSYFCNATISIAI